MVNVTLDDDLVAAVHAQEITQIEAMLTQLLRNQELDKKKEPPRGNLSLTPRDPG